MKECVLLIFGGKSVEHDISIITALQVAKHLPEKYDFLPVYMDKNGCWWVADNLTEIGIYKDLPKLAKNLKRVTFLAGENALYVFRRKKLVFFKRVSAVLNCCHGHIGEDGNLQGLLSSCDIPQTSADVLGSSLCTDKVLMKDVCKANGIATPEYLSYCETYNKEENNDENGNYLKKFVQNCSKKISFPLVVKPASLGSSIGISVCENEAELTSAVSFALGFDKKILVEKFVQNLREFNCAAFLYKGDLVLSSVNEVTGKGAIYSFEDKYLSKENQPKETGTALAKKIRELTKKVYKLFGLSGVVRVDFLYDEKARKLFVNEVNTIPGSLAFYLFKDIAFKELISVLIEESLRIHEKSSEKILFFESDALKTFENVSNLCKK